MSDRLTFTRISYPLPDAAYAIGLGMTSLRELIDSGELTVHYLGTKATKPVIRAIDLDAYVDAQPTERRAA